MTTKNDQPMEVGEPNTEGVLEQDAGSSSQQQSTPSASCKTETVLTEGSGISPHPQEEISLKEERKLPDQSDVPKTETEGSDEKVPDTTAVGEPEVEELVKNKAYGEISLDASAKNEIGLEETPKKKRASSKKRKEQTAVPDSGEEDAKAVSVSVKPESNSPVLPEAPAVTTASRVIRRVRQDVLSIDSVRSVQTDEDKAKNDLLDLLESLRTGRILTGTVQGVERTSESNEPVAVIYHGVFKIIIPVEEAIDKPEDYRGMPPKDVHQYLLTKRMGAEIDYIVKGIDTETNVAVASRKEAMKAKRKQYFFGTDRDGNNLLYAGICAEARVVSVIRAGIFIELFGAETYIALRELSYQRMLDATEIFQSGQRVLVKVLEIDKTDRNNVQVKASVKQATENPYEKAIRRYTVGNCYVGTVSVVDTNGVFVSFDGGIDCLCTYPKRGRPPRGARVAVRILGINHETNRIWGVITHTASPR